MMAPEEPLGSSRGSMHRGPKTKGGILRIGSALTMSRKDPKEREEGWLLSHPCVTHCLVTSVPLKKGSGPSDTSLAPVPAPAKPEAVSRGGKGGENPSVRPGA